MRTKHGKKTKPRCMNVTKYCKDQLMCPYFAGEYSAESCDLHGKMTTNCTACARHAQRGDASISLVSLLSEAPCHLRHSPLDPTCPARLAEKKSIAQAASKRQSSSSSLKKRAPTLAVTPDSEPTIGPAVNKAWATEDNTDMQVSC